MLCILCVTASDKLINIFDKNGLHLNICHVITKHFWLKPKSEDTNANRICCSCWEALDSFHKFYRMVEESHIVKPLIKDEETGVVKSSMDDDETDVDSLDLFEGFLASDIKSNSSHDSEKTDQAEFDTQLSVDEKTTELKPDSESHIPLHNLRNRRQPDERRIYANDDDNEEETPKVSEEKDFDSPNSKTNPKSISNDKDTPKRKVSCKEFDTIIKQNIPLRCETCNKSLASFFALKEHYRSAHNETGYVICCDKKYNSRHALVHHILLHQNPDAFKCPICGRIMANKKSFKYHTKTHINKERIYHCDKCKKSFSREEKLERHMQTHLKIEQVCELCGKVTRDKHGLRQHKLRDHSGVPKKRLECTKCGAYLADASTLHTHMKYQHPKTEDIYKCSICGKISSSGYGLKRHIAYMHKNERSHKCTICDRGFKTAQRLRYLSANIGANMLCILCVTARDPLIQVFDKDGLSRHINEIIKKHFWLQPNAEDANARAICCSCWSALNTFHRFYQEVEQAHARLVKVKLPIEDDVSDADHFDAYNEFFSEDVKVESYEDPKLELPQYDEEVAQLAQFTKRADTARSKSDSESDVPLVRLSRQRSSTRNHSYAQVTADDSDSGSSTKRTRKTRIPDDYEKPKSKLNRFVSDDSTYNKRKISCKEFDKLIKQNMKLSCELCREPLASFFVLKEHYRSVHNETGYVNCCDKKFDSRHSLVQHILLHQNPDFYKCEKCGKILTNMKSLKNHLKKHLHDKHIYQCDTCKKSFCKKEKLERHMKTHVSVDHICEHCGKVIRGRHSLKQHQLREHSVIPRQRVQCEKCGVYLADNSSRSFHMKYQHPENDVVHVCNICGKVSTTGYGLKRHILYMHKCGRPHKCAMCEKAFKTAQKLRVSRII